LQNWREAPEEARRGDVQQDALQRSDGEECESGDAHGGGDLCADSAHAGGGILPEEGHEEREEDGEQVRGNGEQGQELREGCKLRCQDVARADGEWRQDEKIAAIGEKHVPFEKCGEADDDESEDGREELDAA
jgi:hypothetical protein